MRLISSRLAAHCTGVVILVPSLITSGSGISLRMGSELTSGIGCAEAEIKPAAIVTVRQRRNRVMEKRWEPVSVLSRSSLIADGGFRKLFTLEKGPRQGGDEQHRGNFCHYFDRKRLRRAENGSRADSGKQDCAVIKTEQEPW